MRLQCRARSIHRTAHQRAHRWSDEPCTRSAGLATRVDGQACRSISKPSRDRIGSDRHQASAMVAQYASRGRRRGRPVRLVRSETHQTVRARAKERGSRRRAYQLVLGVLGSRLSGSLRPVPGHWGSAAPTRGRWLASGLTACLLPRKVPRSARPAMSHTPPHILTAPPRSAAAPLGRWSRTRTYNPQSHAMPLLCFDTFHATWVRSTDPLPIVSPTPGHPHTSRFLLPFPLPPPLPSRQDPRRSPPSSA